MLMRMLHWQGWVGRDQEGNDGISHRGKLGGWCIEDREWWLLVMGFYIWDMVVRRVRGLW
jgi:hypothetical protein